MRLGPARPHAQWRCERAINMANPLLFWGSVVLILTVTMMNLVALSSRNDLLPTYLMAEYGSSLREGFISQSSSMGYPTGNSQSPPLVVAHDHQQRRQHPTIVERRSRTLVGYLTMDSANDCSYRKRHRELFQIWNDTRVCTLADLKESPLKYQNCQLVYTFVLGAAHGPDSPTVIVNQDTPLHHSTPTKLKCADTRYADMTYLNIRENMNEGKSPTFFYFASTIMTEYNIDYAMKMDGDSILHLHDWFQFSHARLPPNGRGIVGGALRHKALWKYPNDLKAQMESYWNEEYDGVHLYLAGQCYFMSLDLCVVVAMEAPHAATYMAGFEDHDVSSMAFHSSRPIHLIAISKSHRFWEHPVKGQPRWERIRKRERARMEGLPFEGTVLRLYQDL